MEPEEALHVGDDYLDDCWAAEQVWCRRGCPAHGVPTRSAAVGWAAGCRYVGGRGAQAGMEAWLWGADVSSFGTLRRRVLDEPGEADEDWIEGPDGLLRHASHRC